MQWKLEELMASADAVSVAQSIGMRMKTTGSVTFIECLDGRQEKHPLSHCQLFRDGYYDYTTHEGGNTYMLVKNYYANVLGHSISHDEICEKIADTCGGAQFYLVNREEKKKLKRKKPFPLDPKQGDYEAIGLVTPRQINLVLSYSDHKDEKHDERYDDGYAKIKRCAPPSLYAMYYEDEATFNWLVLGKIEEAKNRLRADFQWSKTIPDEAKYSDIKSAVVKVIVKKDKNLERIEAKVRGTSKATARMPSPARKEKVA